MKKRIGLLIDTLIGGGAERITLNFAETFSVMGHDVHIFLIRNEVHHVVDQSQYSIHPLTEDGILSQNKFINKRRLTSRFLEVIKEIESDGQSFSFFISSSGDFDHLAKMSGLKNIYLRYRNSMWDFIQSKVGNKTGWKAWERRWRHTLRHRAIYNHSNIVAITDAMRFDLCEKVGIKPRSITTIYNPFDFDRIRQRGKEKVEGMPKESYLIYAAKFENRKNHQLLIEAYAKAVPKQKLVLIGDVYTDSDRETLKALRHQIKALHLEDKILFPGFQKNPYPWIKHADLFVMSSNNEGLPTVLIESLILDTPVVSVDCPTGPSEILVGELAEYLSPVKDSAALAKNITKALDYYPEITGHYLDKFNNLKVAGQYLAHCVE
ncbi:MAG: glycosyltransferase [bacterium]